MNRKEMSIELRKRTAGKFKQPAVSKNAPAVAIEFIQMIADELAENGKAVIPGLGILKVVERPAFTGDTPEGKTVNRPAAKVVRMIPGKLLKERLK